MSHPGRLRSAISETLPLDNGSACKPVSSCTRTNVSEKETSLAMLVQSYRESDAYWGQEHDLYQWYGDRSLSLEEAIDRAVKSIQPDGKIHGHQHLVGRDRLQQLAVIAQDHIEQFRDAGTWENVYQIVACMIVRVRGAGVLAHYDITNRISGYLGLEQTVLRVHAGAKEGALALGLKSRDGKIALEDLPSELRSLGAMHTENFLCIFKDDLKSLET